MPAYAMAHLRSVDVGAEIVEYLDRIDATLEPFDGRFIVHGAVPEVREDEFPGTIVVIEFPDRAAATAWYESPAYQAILPLRTEHSDGTAFIIDGVKPGHRAPDSLRAA
jgi:uncharacterized protein (DUF1330 family)